MKNNFFSHQLPITPNHPEWQEANQRYLMSQVDVVRSFLSSRKIEENGNYHVPDFFPALDNLCSAFGLTKFERSILLLCIGMEVESKWSDFCSKANGGNPGLPYPNFNLAIQLFPENHWSAVTPTSALRQHQLIHIGAGSVLNLCPLHIDERILHYVLGFDYLEQKLRGIVKPLLIDREIDVPSHQQLAEQLANTWIQGQAEGRLPILQLCGDEVASKRAIAYATCQECGVNLHIMSAIAISQLRNPEINEILRLWERESILTNSALLLDCDELDTTEPNKEGGIAHLIENISGLLIITSFARGRLHQRPLINIEVHKPNKTEQRDIWQKSLSETYPRINNYVDILVANFSLNATTIHTVCTEARAKSKAEVGKNLEMNILLWDTCRTHARPRLDELAQPIQPGAAWDDLVLPELQRQVLRDIAAHVRQRTKVYEKWGFGNKGGRGLGISALFAGASGTGKTMAAEVIAHELRLDLYRIDLSSVVSKYIGETEKNLRRIFDAAETGGAILLFDEADALFGKRSEVKDSHDRHANIEVGYLLQRMESYQGLAVLTTNLKGSLDQAFLRRIRFIVQFPFPDINQRQEIWQRVFPSGTPTEGLDAELLARLNVSGGNIRNIALNAAFLAADANQPVQMKHILQAAKSEYAKLERPLTDSEVKDWI